MRYVPARQAPVMGEWCLRLRFQATRDEEEDCSQISQALPWYWRLSRQDRAFFSMESLRRNGTVLLVCEGPEETFQYAGEIRGSQVTVQVFDPDGPFRGCAAPEPIRMAGRG